MKRRIVRWDSLCWAIQEYQEGGQLIERGPYTGKLTQPRWKAPNKFYTSLRNAALDYMREYVGDSASDEAVTLSGIVERLETAERRVSEHVEGLLAKLTDETLVGLLQERGYRVISPKKPEGETEDGEFRPKVRPRKRLSKG